MRDWDTKLATASCQAGCYQEIKSYSGRQRTTNRCVCEKAIPAPNRPGSHSAGPKSIIKATPGSMPKGRRPDVTRTVPARKQDEDMDLVGSGNCNLLAVFRGRRQCPEI